MSKVAVVYWSGTGNTQAMAEAVAAAASAEVFTSDEFSADQVGNFDSIAFGCPSMGAEQLEEESFQPMWDSVKDNLAGKKIGLFGSWGWGGGEWMTTWKDECDGLGLTLVSEPVMCQEAPDDAALAECDALGKALAE